LLDPLAATSTVAKSVLVVGLGNPVLGDDGVGWKVADLVERSVRCCASPVEVDCVGLGGVALMERLIGYDEVVLVDAICTGRWPVGTVRRLPFDELADPLEGYSASAHDASLACALRLGRDLGARIPTRIVVVAIEARSLYEFSDRLSPAVAQAVPRAVRVVLRTLGMGPGTQATGLQE
jgi:hydrogenase maturation protease